MKTQGALWWIVIAVVIVAVAGYFWLKGSDPEKLTYRFDKIDRGDIVVAISATGNLNAVTTVEVGSQVSGTIAKLYVDFNSVVKQGQLLAQLDPTFLQASLAQEEANVSGAEAQVNQNNRNLKRTQELFDKGMVSQSDLDVATTAAESAAAGLMQAEASRDRARVNLQYATIKAPISGVVISRDVDVGQTVAASLQAPKLFSIANDLSKMQVTASVDEADIGQVKDGQNVSFRVDSYPDVDFYGKVGQIRLAPVVTQNVVTYNVVINVDNPDLKLMPGMTATCSIEVAKRENVLRAPLQALRFTPANWTGPAGRGNVNSASSTMGGAQVSPEHPAMDSTRAKSADTSGGQGARHQWEDSARMGRHVADSTRGTRPGGDSTRRMSSQPNGGGAPSASGSGNGASRGRMWLLENGQLRPVPVKRGIQNQRYVELIECPLKEGDSVVIGTNGNSSASASSQSQNPFIPRMPGGGPQRGGGGR